MLASIITLLIYVCILALIIYLVIWVLRDVLGVPVPDRVVQILWVIVALVVLLWLVNALAGGGLRVPSLRL